MSLLPVFNNINVYNYKEQKTLCFSVSLQHSEMHFKNNYYINESVLNECLCIYYMAKGLSNPDHDIHICSFLKSLPQRAHKHRSTQSCSLYAVDLQFPFSITKRPKYVSAQRCPYVQSEDREDVMWQGWCRAI